MKILVLKFVIVAISWNSSYTTLPASYLGSGTNEKKIFFKKRIYKDYRY